MKKIIAIIGIAVCMFCFAGCGGSGMSYEESQEVSQMEDSLEHYEALDEAHILTDDTSTDVAMALTEIYGEEEAQAIMEIIYDNTPELGDYVY